MTCLAQPITLRGMSDNHAQASFLGVTFQCDSYSSPETATGNPLTSGGVCSNLFFNIDQNYTFKYYAQNNI